MKYLESFRIIKKANVKTKQNLYKKNTFYTFLSAK